MRYEWDEKKNQANRVKHGISFDLAPALFSSPVVETADYFEDEERFIALGHVDGDVFVCVYTDRDVVRRIISLRKASKNEQKVYYSHS